MGLVFGIANFGTGIGIEMDWNGDWIENYIKTRGLFDARLLRDYCQLILTSFLDYLSLD